MRGPDNRKRFLVVRDGRTYLVVDHPNPKIDQDPVSGNYVVAFFAIILIFLTLALM